MGLRLTGKRLRLSRPYNENHYSRLFQNWCIAIKSTMSNKIMYHKKILVTFSRAQILFGVNYMTNWTFCKSSFLMTLTSMFKTEDFIDNWVALWFHFWCIIHGQVLIFVIILFFFSLSKCNIHSLLIESFTSISF